MAADTADGDLKAHLVGDALENAVSAFDGFGREAAEAHKHLRHTAESCSSSFQNLANADGQRPLLFGFGLSDGVTRGRMEAPCALFSETAFARPQNGRR